MLIQSLLKNEFAYKHKEKKKIKHRFMKETFQNIQKILTKLAPFDKLQYYI